MDADQFREAAKACVDYIADYYENIRDRPVLPSVEPGYLQHLIPNETPQQGEDWKAILGDVEKVIMPGITHWQSPNFYAYYPTSHSFPAIIGEMLCAGIGCLGFSWIASPACTELEVVTMDWMGKLLNLPEEFLNSSDGPGGGTIQGTASESTLVTLLAAKERMVQLVKEQNPSLSEAEIKGKLVAYTSDQSNSSVEKAGLIASVPMRQIESDRDCRLRGSALEEAIKKDREAGLIPCYLAATLGTTGTCAFDALEELGPLCKKENIWMHIDAAYAGSAFACEEYRHLMKGVNYADSFNFNPHKWMLVNFDCSALWVRDAKYLVEAFTVDRIYLKDMHKGAVPEYRHWQIPLGRRFRALKLWFVLRSYGVEGIQKHIRKQVSLAKYFEKLVGDDNRFEVCTSSLGLVCFRLKGPDELTQSLLDKLAERKNIYVIPCHYRGQLIIRFVICSRQTDVKDVESAFKEISSIAKEIVGSPRTELNRNILDLDSVLLDGSKIRTIQLSPKLEKDSVEKTK